MKLNRFFRLDTSTQFLILANIVTIVFAVVQKWDVTEIMWVYWAQSVIIGLFTCRRILDLKQFSTEGVLVNHKPVEPTRATQKGMAGFFLVHYGLFHVVYFVFLYSREQPLPGLPVIGIALCILVFLVNHGVSYWHNRQRDMNRKPNIGTVMLFPYARIIPMHLTIIFGSNFAKGSTGTLVLFLVLKTLADVIMHMVEHREKREEEKTGSI